MTRYVNKSVIQVQKEVTYGTDPGSWVAAMAVLVSNLSCNPLSAQNVDRALIRRYFGSAEQLVGSAYKTLTFDVEYVNGGTAGTAAAWDVLLQMCGYAAGSPLTTPSRVEHAIAAPSAQASGTLRYFDDGVLHLLLGAKGSVSLDLTVGVRPVFKFSFTGLDGGDTAVANPTTDYTAFKTPLAVTDANTGALTLGCTYATGALTGGTEYVSGGLTLDLGNSVNFIDLLGTAALSGQRVEVTDRKAVGKLMLELTAANEASFMTNIKANASQSVALIHGTTAGYKMLLFAPVVQLINPTLQDKNGRRMIGFDMRLLPSTGNDDLLLVAL